MRLHVETPDLKFDWSNVMRARRTRTVVGLGLGIVTVVLAAVAGVVPTGAQGLPGNIVAIPLRSEGGWFAVPVVTEAGDTLEFVLDTAAGVSVLTTSGAATLGAASAGEASVVGARGPEQVALARAPTVWLGSLEMAGGVRPVLRDATLTTTGGATFAGVVGMDFLRGYDVVVDAPRRRLLLRLESPEAWPADVESRLGPARSFALVQGGFIRLDVHLNGALVPAVLDTGARETNVSRPAAAVAGLEALGAAVTLPQRGVGGGDVRLEGYPARIGELRIGDARQTNVPVTVVDLPVFEVLLPGEAAVVLVGSPFFEACAVAIDYRRSLLRTCGG